MEAKMIQRVLLFAVVFAVMTSAAFAKKEKTVVRQDTLVTDVRYGFVFVVNSNWKVKDFNEPSVERAFLEKKNYSINREAQAYGGDYTIPTVVVYAQEFGGTVDDFEALLLKSLEEHQSDNPIIQKLGLLQNGEYIQTVGAVIDSIPARQIFLKRSYKRLLSSDPYGSGTPNVKQTEKYVNDHEVHEVYIAKKDSAIIVFQAFCEREFYAKENRDEFQEMARSLKF
jgi:hypothetical protein